MPFLANPIIWKEISVRGTDEKVIPYDRILNSWEGRSPIGRRPMACRGPYGCAHLESNASIYSALTERAIPDKSKGSFFSGVPLTGGKLPVVESIAMARRADGRMVAAVLAKLEGWKATTLVVETNRATATENFILRTEA